MIFQNLSFIYSSVLPKTRFSFENSFAFSEYFEGVFSIRSGFQLKDGTELSYASQNVCERFILNWDF